jgi:hypothetical protein
MSGKDCETPWTLFFKPDGASVHSINVSEEVSKLNIGDGIQFGPMGIFKGRVVGVVPSRYKISADDIPAEADPVEWIERAAKLKGAME